MKKIYYKATCLKYIVEDDFENGCLPDTASDFAVDFVLTDESLKRLIRNIETVTDGKACRFEDEINRIEVQVLKTQEGYKAGEIAKRL